MNCIINSALALFAGKTEGVCVQSGAIAIAVVSFVLGAIVTCLVCKVCHGPCGKKGCAGGKKSQQPKQRSEQKFEKKHPAPADGSIEIYVGNLSYDLTEDVLRKEFEAYGTVNSARIITNRANGRSKGFGFVHMPNRAEADAAVAALSDKEILGRKLKCNEAKNVE